jgi:hypothetical protein
MNLRGWKHTIVISKFNNRLNVEYSKILKYIDPKVREYLKAEIYDGYKLNDEELLETFKVYRSLQSQLIERLLKRKLSYKSQKFLSNLKRLVKYELSENQLRSILVHFSNTLNRREYENI